MKKHVHELMIRDGRDGKLRLACALCGQYLKISPKDKRRYVVGK